jgi:hypothetical protein
MVIIPIIRIVVVLVKLLNMVAAGSIPVTTKASPAAMATGILGILGWKKQITVKPIIIPAITTGDMMFPPEKCLMEQIPFRKGSRSPGYILRIFTPYIIPRK